MRGVQLFAVGAAGRGGGAWARMAPPCARIALAVTMGENLQHFGGLQAAGRAKILLPSHAPMQQ